MTPDEIRLWQQVYVARSNPSSGTHGSYWTSKWANEAVEAFREANRRPPEPNVGRL